VSQLSFSTLLERLNLGLGSAVSVVLFLIVGLIAVVFIKGFGAAANPSSGDESMSVKTKQRIRLVSRIHRRGRRLVGAGLSGLLMLSLKTPASATDGSFIPHHWTLDNYRDIFNQSVFTAALRNSIGIGLIATALAVLLASSAAYAIARLDFPGKQTILAVALMVTLFPQVSLVGPLYKPVAPDRAVSTPGRA